MLAHELWQLWRPSVIGAVALLTCEALCCVIGSDSSERVVGCCDSHDSIVSLNIESLELIRHDRSSACQQTASTKLNCSQTTIVMARLHKARLFPDCYSYGPPPQN